MIYCRKEVGDMFEQILALFMPHLQMIIAALLFVAVFLELVHIGQIRRIHKKINYAARCLQKYLDTVFYDDGDEESALVEEQQLQETETVQQGGQTAIQVDTSKLLKSRQEENMRVSLAHKKLQKDGELLDTVLQEIFD